MAWLTIAILNCCQLERTGALKSEMTCTSKELYLKCTPMWPINARKNTSPMIKSLGINDGVFFSLSWPMFKLQRVQCISMCWNVLQLIPLEVKVPLVRSSFSDVNRDGVADTMKLSVELPVSSQRKVTLLAAYQVQLLGKAGAMVKLIGGFFFILFFQPTRIFRGCLFVWQTNMCFCFGSFMMFQEGTGLISSKQNKSCILYSIITLQSNLGIQRRHERSNEFPKASGTH